MLPPDVAADQAGTKLVEHLKESFAQTTRTSPGLLGQLAAMGRFNSTRRLEALAVHPTLVIAGSLDAVVPPANSQSLHQRIPGSQLVLWEGAGHFFWATRTPEVSSLLSRFLIECDER